MYPECTHARCHTTQVPALQALLALTPQMHRLRINGVRSVLRNGQGISQYLSQGLANPHPRSIVNGTIGDLEGARPTIVRPPVVPANIPPKSDQNQPPNLFSWSAKSPVKIGRALLAGHTAVGRRAAVRPKPAIGAAPALRG